MVPTMGLYYVWLVAWGCKASISWVQTVGLTLMFTGAIPTRLGLEWGGVTVMTLPLSEPFLLVDHWFTDSLFESWAFTQRLPQQTPIDFVAPKRGRKITSIAMLTSRS